MTQETQTTLVSMLRQPAYLAPQDSLVRGVETLRYSGMEVLPVVGVFGELIGVFDMRCVRPLLGREDRELRMTEPVAAWMRRPEAVGRADMSLNQVLDVLTATGETALFIVARDGRYAGAVTMADILSPAPIPVRPPMVGGMATPWGVYLTNGNIQAGAGNLALVGSGMLMGAMLAFSAAVVPLFCSAAQRFAGVPLFDILHSRQPETLSATGLIWYALQCLPMPILLLLMRLLPISGYHAAEHQAVHAMERGEVLIPEIVKRMPRVHPRCGTNLLAGVLVFTGVSSLLSAPQLGLDMPTAAIIGALATLFTWRGVGGFLQQYFTTRPASDKQIASGIAAAEDLQRKFLATEPRRPSFFRRLWCMGLPQMSLSGSITFTVVGWLINLAYQHHLLPS